MTLASLGREPNRSRMPGTVRQEDASSIESRGYERGYADAASGLPFDPVNDDTLKVTLGVEVSITAGLKAGGSLKAECDALAEIIHNGVTHLHRKLADNPALWAADAQLSNDIIITVVRLPDGSVKGLPQV